MTTEQRYKRHKDLAAELNEIYIAKNKDYGNSFGDIFQELGIITAITRMSDKLNRLKSLAKKPEAERKVKNESIIDTLKDLANYALMTIIELEVQKENEKL
jgi:hypothetical protein